MADARRMTTAVVVASVMAGEHGDFVREAVALVARELMEAEISVDVRAELGELSVERTAHRNGYRPRPWETRVGESELLIPRKLAGSGVARLPGGRDDPAQDDGQPAALIRRDLPDVAAAWSGRGSSRRARRRTWEADVRVRLAVVEGASEGARQAADGAEQTFALPGMDQNRRPLDPQSGARASWNLGQNLAVLLRDCQSGLTLTRFRLYWACSWHSPRESAKRGGAHV